MKICTLFRCWPKILVPKVVLKIMTLSLLLVVLVASKANSTAKISRIIDLSGKVIDDTGLPIPGASVKVKGTNNGVVTNAQGQFKLAGVSADAILVISYIGYITQEKKVGSVNFMTIKMATDLNNLNDVVVVGYGTQTKATVTSSVAQISREEINVTPGASLQNMLTGKMTGLTTLQRTGQPGADGATIFIRGVSTLSGFDTSPLILVDNVQYDSNQFSQIDQNEIETLSILKDASATAIYGIKGANGVILVTTRRGKTGKAKINLRSEAGVNIISKPFVTLGSYDAAILYNEALRNDGSPERFTQQDLDIFQAGTDPYGHPDVNWDDVIFKKATLQTDHNIDISGGSDRVKYFATLGYLYQNGLINDIPYNGPAIAVPDIADYDNNYFYKRYKFRSNIDINPTKTLKFSLDVAGTYSEVNTPDDNTTFSSIHAFYIVQPFGYPVYNPDGTFGYANPSVFSPTNAAQNPAALFSLSGYNRTYNNFINTNFSATQQLDGITKGLSVKGLVAFSINNEATRKMTRNQIPSFFYNAVTGVYSPKDLNVYRVSPLVLSSSGGDFDKVTSFQGILNYVRSFGNHNVSGLLLFNRGSSIVAEATPDNLLGYTFRGTYNYKQKYLFEVSGAYNGSAAFASQKKYTLFPAVSVGWDIAQENFFKEHLKFFNQFKLRGSYGFTGDDSIAGYAYGYQDFYSVGGAFLYNFGETSNAQPAIIEGKIGNNDVSWANERKANIGLDLSMFKGKLTAKIDYFDNFRYDILTNRQTVPAFFGVPSATLPPVNLGEVSNKGLELELNYNGKINNLGINIAGNFSYAKNKIVNVDEPVALYPWLQQTGNSVGMVPQFTWLGYYTAEEAADNTTAKPIGGTRQGWLKYKDLNGDGMINNYDMSYQGGSNTPTTVIGLTLGFSYKNFSCSTLWQSNLGGEASTTFAAAVPYGSNTQPFHQQRWTPETASTATFPALTTNFNGTYMNPGTNPSTFWSTSTDFLRLRSAQMAYKLPVNFVNKLGLANAQIYANAYNLFTISGFYNRYQYDPEIGRNQIGYVYPTTKLINMGISLTLK